MMCILFCLYSICCLFSMAFQSKGMKDEKKVIQIYSKVNRNPSSSAQKGLCYSRLLGSRTDEVRSRAPRMTSGKETRNYTATTTGSKQPGLDWEIEYQAHKMGLYVHFILITTCTRYRKSH